MAYRPPPKTYYPTHAYVYVDGPDDSWTSLLIRKDMVDDLIKELEEISSNLIGD